MSRMSRVVRQTLTIARRDFVATVYTPTFLLFLLAPLIMIGFGMAGGMGASSVAQSGDAKERLVVIAPDAQAATIRAIDAELRTLYVKREDEAPSRLVVEAPQGDPETQARALINREEPYEALAVLYGPLERPRILHAANAPRSATYLALIAEQTLRAARSGGTAPLSRAEKVVVEREQLSGGAKARVAFLGVFGLFFLTLMLSSQAVGTMAEERSNKVIEVLAAAVPLESVFLGKLLGTFGVAVLFIAFWGTLLANAAKFIPGDLAAGFALLGPAIGGPGFALLFVLYFTMAYLLLGAVFLSIGAQASTQREIQMLSLPITIFQVGMFAFASAAVAKPESWLARAAEIFPFSSPFAMLGHAANYPDVWPHLAALAWQALWVALTVTLGARWFRRGVLQSGSPRLRLKALFGR